MTLSVITNMTLIVRCSSRILLYLAFCACTKECYVYIGKNAYVVYCSTKMLWL